MFPRKKKKGNKNLSKPLKKLEDLAHTVDERYVLTYLPRVHPLSHLIHQLPSSADLIDKIGNIINEIMLHLGKPNNTLILPNGESSLRVNPNQPLLNLNLKQLENLYPNGETSHG